MFANYVFLFLFFQKCFLSSAGIFHSRIMSSFFFFFFLHVSDRLLYNSHEEISFGVSKTLNGVIDHR